MKRIDKFIAGAGLFLFCIGASGIDSPNMFPPAVITIIGLSILAYAGKEYAESEKED